MSIPSFDEIIEPNDQTAARRDHLEALRALIGNVYPNKFERTTLSGSEDTISNILHHPPLIEIVAEIKAIVATLAERERPPAEIKDALNARLREFGNVRISGRLTTPPRGNFVHLTDGINKLQVYAKKGTFALVRNDAENSLDEENGWEAFGLLDHGDFIGVDGYLFITNTGELSVHVERLQFLAKAMLPMPDKMHGIADAEIRQRQRYYDLIGSSLQVEHEGLTTREVFEVRAKTIASLRRFLEDHGYIEVETPMLTPKATGAAAKPFKTHHNALDIDLYARIAPELYLKRLVVGGFEKVYELNRNFRNEGISYKHNPEFTMLEFYCAYMDVEGMMDFCESLLTDTVKRAIGTLETEYHAQFSDFGRTWRVPVPLKLGDFRRLSMTEAIISSLEEWCPKLGGELITEEWLTDALQRRRLHFALITLAKRGVMQSLHNLTLVEVLNANEIRDNAERLKVEVWNEALTRFSASNLEPATDQNYANEILELFEEVAEGMLINPTFVTNYPKAISPLAKASPDNPHVAERFELFVFGMEIANGFSELNDPREQYERFVDQMSERERGDEEAMVLDEDYIRALSYGMPPAAGIGIGIDRLVMLLTNKHSIRDVILFPHMRPEKKGPASDESV